MPLRLALLLGGTALFILLSILGVVLLSSSSAESREAPRASVQPALDGDLEVDAQGNLRIDLGVRDYFDYFLTYADRLGLERAAELLMDDARERLGEPALSQLQQLLGDYLDYRRACQALELPAISASDPRLHRSLLEQRLTRLASLRRQYLDEAVVKAFYGAEETYSRFLIATLDVQLREDLSEADKQHELERLREKLPEEVREIGGRHGRAIGVQAELERRARAGANEAQLRDFLAMHFDPPVIDRLIEERRRDQHWHERYNEYLARLEEMRAEPERGDFAQRARELRRRMFTGEELLRVEHYEALHNNNKEATRARAIERR